MGSEKEDRRRVVLRWTLAPLTVAGAVALGATGWAATSGSSATTTAAATASPSDKSTEHGKHEGDWKKGSWRGGWGWGGGWGKGGFGGALHGECVSEKEGGGTQTHLFQRGTVTEVTGSGFTVRSKDGFTRRYSATGDLVVNGDKKGPAGVSKDKEVFVMALKGGGDPAARRVVETSAHKD
ncbi:hypothetical protein [Spirillospora sp. CA-294931]|uniref:hypothetical protein n=1 Tax=Spirillospora sp. CA-294931 TaxID=3240042 RepID=UPI003D943F6C